MIIRTKMHCLVITKRLRWGRTEEFTYSAEFNCVGAGDKSEEDKTFFEATPAGTLQLSTLRDDFFAPGKDYYIDVTEA